MDGKMHGITTSFNCEAGDDKTLYVNNRDILI